MRKAFIGGNWKCNNTLQQTQAMTSTIIDKLDFDSAKVDVVVAPVYLHLVTVQFTKKHQKVEVAAQNCSMSSFGAFTGEVAAEQIKDLNIKWVILGHSERRTLFNQTDQIVKEKVQNALKNGLKIIFCFGETLSEREEKKTIQVIERQLNAIKEVVDDWNNIVLAYEPVWAIGTGKVATVDQVEEIHNWIRGYLDKIGQKTQQSRIIYGGSVNEKNCQELIKIKQVDGFLVGGASLRPAFIDIVNSTKAKFD